MLDLRVVFCRGPLSPILLITDMIGRDKVEQLAEQFIEGTEMFLVAVKVSSSNKITVLVDTPEDVTIDECVAMHRFLESNLDRDVEDYELQVSSPGLDTPFKVREQYEKNEGRRVDVVDNDGNKYNGILKNVTVGGFDIEEKVKVKGKAEEKKEIPFNFDEVKSVKLFVTI